MKFSIAIITASCIILFIKAFIPIFIENREPEYVCVMVSASNGEPLSSGKYPNYFWAVIEGPIFTEHPASRVTIYRFKIGYHLIGCYHLIDYSLNSETRVGSEVVTIWPNDLVILNDNLHDFNSSHVVAERLLQKSRSVIE